MNSCYTTKDLISEAKSTDGIRFTALNNFYVQGIGTVAKVNIKEKKLREKIFELGYELTDVNYGQNPYNEKYISSFSFYKKDKKKELNIKLCEDAIRDAHRGMPSPNLSTSNINKAIALCSLCCKDALEDSFYKDVPYLKREAYLEFFPNSKYNTKIRQDIADVKSGKKRDVSAFEAITMGIAKTDIGKATIEMLKSLPTTSSDYSSNNPNQPYILNLSKGNNSTVIYEVGSYGTIEVIDGGIFTTNTSEECYYSTQLFDKNGKLKESITDPFKDNSIQFQYYDLPVKLIVNYCSDIGNKKRIVELIVNKEGRYILNIK